MKNTQAYRYQRTDFKPLPVRLEHMDLALNFTEGRVEAVNILRITPKQRIEKVILDARDLDVFSVELMGNKAVPLRHDYNRDKNSLSVFLPDHLEAGRTFSLRTRTSCVPSDSILDGIYKDTTPPGCPQQYISQCQQWGFQRIAPVFDDCTAKCTMTTSIEADARYTHLISNGNVCRRTNPHGKPVLKPGDPSRKIITYENNIPMAPYLFIAAVGTWDTLEDEVTYPSGRKVRLEYLVPPGRIAGARVPMQILKRSVLWQNKTQEYEYEREVYRTICMEKSNFGGMENVGNTTIITDAALVDDFTGDTRLEYAHAVIVHEFEHNQCGSDVTMETPFDMWLNEAFTVDVERQFLMTCFDPACIRLDEIASMRAPLGGPLAVEDAGHLGNIVRDGFNDPDELVDGVTYVKAAEVIRMLRLVIGEKAFRDGKNLYFSRYKGSNANTDQFFGCFEEKSGRDLTVFKSQWLHTIGYPKIEAAYRYDKPSRRLSINLCQTRSGTGNLFHVPVEIAAVDSDGRDIPGTSRLVELPGRPAAGSDAEMMQLSFDDIPEPAFVSINRNCSFYGTFTDLSATAENLTNQIRLDPDRVNRVEAMRRLTDIERIRILREPSAEVSRRWIDTYAHVVRDRTIPDGIKAHLLAIDEQSLNREYLPWYRERYNARRKLLLAAATALSGDLVGAFNSVDTYTRGPEPADGIEARRLKAVLLRTIVELDTPEVHDLAERHFRRAWNISDKLNTLNCINLSGHPRRRDLMEEGYRLWKDHLSAYTGYLAIVGGGRHDDVFEMLEVESKRETFHAEHPTHSRSLFAPMAANNKMLWTDEGIAWMTRTLIRMAPVNENTTIRLASCFQHVHRLAPDLKPKVLAALQEVCDAVDGSKYPSAAGRIRAYLREPGSKA